MANNIPVTAGSGTTVATDDVSGVHYQVIKIAAGDEDSAARIGGDATNGLDVDVTRLPALVAGTANIGDVDVLTVPADPFGANADAAVAAGATGSIQAKLRRLTTDIDAIKTSVAAATPAGTNAIGKLAANSGVDIGDVDITSVLPGTGALNLGKIEDAAHTTGDVGVMVLGVRNDAGTALAGATGDYIPLSTDSVGALRVTGGGGGTQYNEGDTDASITGTALLWEDGSDTLRTVSATNPLPTEIISGSFSLTSGDDPLTVGGDSDLIVPTITISTSAYTIGDVVGGRIQLTNALGTLRSGVLMSIVVSWNSSIAPALDILFFDAQPTQNTADNAAFAWNSADDALVLWKQSIETTDYFTVPGATARTFACMSPPAPVLKSNGSQDLWMYIVTRTAVTAASTSGLRVKLGISRD